jgi:hypothetical protein
LTAGLRDALPAARQTTPHELIFSSYGDIKPELEVLEQATSLLDALFS